MGIEEWTMVLGWGAAINVGLLAFWTLALTAFGDLIYSIHKRFFALSKEAWTAAMFGYLAHFKIITIAFFIVPYIALRIVGE